VTTCPYSFSISSTEPSVEALSTKIIS